MLLYMQLFLAKENLYFGQHWVAYTLFEGSFTAYIRGTIKC